MPALSYLVFTAITILLAAPSSRVAGVLSKRIFLISLLEELASRATSTQITKLRSWRCQIRRSSAVTGRLVRRPNSFLMLNKLKTTFYPKQPNKCVFKFRSKVGLDTCLPNFLTVICNQI